MKHGSLFTGIGGFEVGFAAAGVETAWSAEIDPFCNRILASRFPQTPNLGNVEAINGRRIEPVGVISFGSPCQDLSAAGKRAGLAGARSGLFFQAARIINECRPAFAIWENVPGALTSNGGRDFATVLYTFRELGANDVAWRTIDSQYFGVPQQRRRLYLVADFRGRRAGEVLFDAERCRGHLAPGRAAPEGDPAAFAGGLRGLGGAGGRDAAHMVPDPCEAGPTGEGLHAVAKSLGSNGTGGQRLDLDHDTYVMTHGPAPGLAFTLSARDEKGVSSSVDQVSLIYGIQDARPLARKMQNGSGFRQADVAYTLDGLNTQAVAIPQAFTTRLTMDATGQPRDTTVALTSGHQGDGTPMLHHGKIIRRLTPLECERLQGFPDGWTCLCQSLDSWAADPGRAMFACTCSISARYRALGNAVTTTVVEDLAENILKIV